MLPSMPVIFRNVGRVSKVNHRIERFGARPEIIFLEWNLIN